MIVFFCMYPCYLSIVTFTCVCNPYFEDPIMVQSLTLAKSASLNKSSGEGIEFS